jgi:YhcH/YjgK/YiaL family protein
MIIDELSNLGKYIHLVPELKEVIKFITENDLSLIPDGKVTLNQINGFVNFQTIPAKCDTLAKYESHRKMIDVQIPLTEDEHMLYVPIT